MKTHELKSIIKEIIKECLNEVAPEGWEGTVKGMKKHSDIDNPWALSHWMKNKGYKPHLHEEDEEEVPDKNPVPDLPPEPSPENPDPDALPHDEDEEEETKLIKGLAMIILKLLKMHNTEDFAGDDGDENEGEPESELSPTSPAPEFPPKKSPEKGEKLNEKKDKKWIQKAVDPKHKGYCTPMTKSTCTPRRKALAKRFKKGLKEVLSCYDANEILREAGAAYKVNDGRSQIDRIGEINRAREIQEDPNVSESNVGHVQARSCKTITDVPQNPENTRDVEVPVP